MGASSTHVTVGCSPRYVVSAARGVPDGLMVTAVVNFDDLTSGATAALVAKSDAGGFALERAAGTIEVET